ncbi:MAG: hypothetical protein JWM95_3802 [Gemmatimonadetes bacterium]|nr:hypothetical protein [Gemmatimonadota bacterium]
MLIVLQPSVAEQIGSVLRRMPERPHWFDSSPRSRAWFRACHDDTPVQIDSRTAAWRPSSPTSTHQRTIPESAPASSNSGTASRPHGARDHKHHGHHAALDHGHRA